MPDNLPERVTIDGCQNPLRAVLAKFAGKLFPALCIASMVFSACGGQQSQEQTLPVSDPVKTNFELNPFIPRGPQIGSFCRDYKRDVNKLDVKGEGPVLFSPLTGEKLGSPLIAEIEGLVPRYNQVAPPHCTLWEGDGVLVLTKLPDPERPPVQASVELSTSMCRPKVTHTPIDLFPEAIEAHVLEQGLNKGEYMIALLTHEMAHTCESHSKFESVDDQISSVEVYRYNQVKDEQQLEVPTVKSEILLSRYDVIGADGGIIIYPVFEEIRADLMAISVATEINLEDYQSFSEIPTDITKMFFYFPYLLAFESTLRVNGYNLTPAELSDMFLSANTLEQNPILAMADTLSSHDDEVGTNSLDVIVSFAVANSGEPKESETLKPSPNWLLTGVGKNPLLQYPDPPNQVGSALAADFFNQVLEPSVLVQ